MSKNLKKLDLLNPKVLSNKIEEYKYLDLSFLTKRDLSLVEKDLNDDQFDKEINSLKNLFFDVNEFYNLVFINGKFFENFSNLPTSLLINKENENVKNFSNDKTSFDKTNFDNSPLKNLNFSFNSKILEFSFTKSLEKPLAFIHINTKMNEKNNQKSVYTNYKVSLKKDVKISIVDKFVNFKKNEIFNNNVFDYGLEKESSLDHYILQESIDNLQFNHYKIDLDNRATYRGFLVNQKSKISRFDFEINLNKEESDAQVNGIYLGKNDQILDHYIKTNHNAKKTYSSHYLKGILKNNSKGIFYASTLAKKNVKKIVAKQLNKNILLDDQACVFSRPELWIKADDVKCSHGSTTGQLDIEAIFYLQSRGFNFAQAKEILLKAFIDDLFEKIQNKNIKKEMDKIKI